jgi:hypothetical protein
MTGWPVGVLVGAYLVAFFVQGFIDSRRDIDAPFRRAEIPDPGPGAWVTAGAYRRGVWGGSIPTARLIVTEDWIGIRVRTLFSGVQTYVVDRAEVTDVVVVRVLGPGVGVIGPRGPSRLTVAPFTNRAVVEAQLDRRGWSHVRRWPRLLRPFA